MDSDRLHRNRTEWRHVKAFSCSGSGSLGRGISVRSHRCCPFESLSTRLYSPRVSKTQWVPSIMRASFFFFDSLGSKPRPLDWIPIRKRMASIPASRPNWCSNRATRAAHFLSSTSGAMERYGVSSGCNIGIADGWRCVGQVRQSMLDFCVKLGMVFFEEPSHHVCQLTAGTFLILARNDQGNPISAGI